MLRCLKFFLISFLFCSCQVTSQLSSSKSGLPYSDTTNYHLVFDDEFNTRYPLTVIDGRKWNRTPPWNQSSNRTVDVSWCWPDSTPPVTWDRAYIMRDAADSTTIKVSNGTCKIIANKGRYMGRVTNWPQCDPAHPGYAIGGSKCQDECQIRGDDTIYTCRTNDTLEFKYTVGTLFSKERFRFGYYEIRFRLPKKPDPPFTHQGFGPNFWLWGNRPPETNYSEIDVFEIAAFNPFKSDSNKYTSSCHYAGTSKKWKSAHTDKMGNVLWNDTSWHTAAAWWTKDFVRYYFDDSLYFTVQNNPDVLVDKLCDMYIIVDINAPTPGRCNNFDPVHTSFPYVYEVDYVRVYQEKKQ
jgi:hypothetical protein